MEKQPWMKMYVYLLLKWWCSIVILVFGGCTVNPKLFWQSMFSSHSQPPNYFSIPQFEGHFRGSRPWMQAEGDKGGKDLSTKRQRVPSCSNKPWNPSASKFFGIMEEKNWEGLCEESTDKVFCLFWKLGKTCLHKRWRGFTLFHWQPFES